MNLQGMLLKLAAGGSFMYLAGDVLHVGYSDFYNKVMPLIHDGIDKLWYLANYFGGG